MDGIVKAKARGVQFGQRKKLTAPQITELQNQRKQGALIKTLMKAYRVSKATIYRYLNESNSSPSAQNTSSP
jgi:DNA invertase Pin-like site-specific DNA recombinase